MKFLASDLLEGRGTGTRGHQLAAEYVAAQYAVAGLAPGVNGEWFQDVPFIETKPDAASTMTLTRRGAAPVKLDMFDDFTSSGDPLHADRTVEGEVVFAGYGVTATDQRYDDYARIDVKGKIVALFSGAPFSFPNAVRAHHASTPIKFENAARHGAIGLIYLAPPQTAGGVSWEHIVRYSKQGTMNWTRPDGSAHGVQPTISAAIGLNLENTRLLLGRSADSIFSSVERGKVRSRALGYRARIHLVSRHARKNSPNVVGLLRGSDPQLRDEYVVYTSHLDHVGISDPVDGDSINNGAFDNASGIAAMLEIARALAIAKPRRSILFIATTAEEHGMKGADYFANNSTVPIDQIVANINIDMLVMTHAMRDLLAFGAETSDLGDVARDVARQMNTRLAKDPFPEEMIFVRSDQIAFVRRGVPAIYIGPGFDAAARGVNGEREYSEWLRTRYHSPKDDLDQPIDWTAALLLTEFDYRLGLAVANADARPRWKRGDFFGETFSRKQ